MRKEGGLLANKLKLYVVELFNNIFNDEKTNSPGDASTPKRTPEMDSEPSFRSKKCTELKKIC